MSPEEESECHGESESPIATPPPRGLQWALARVGNGYGGKQKWAGRLVPVLPAGRTVTTGVFSRGSNPMEASPPAPTAAPADGRSGGPPMRPECCRASPPNSKAPETPGCVGLRGAEDALHMLVLALYILVPALHMLVTALYVLVPARSFTYW